MSSPLAPLRTALLGLACVGVAMPGCYSAGGGTDPPANQFYFPVGLAASPDGKYLYAVNSDFDLQWNGGTLQSYDLVTIRGHVAELVAANVAHKPQPGDIPWVAGSPPNTCNGSVPGPQSSGAATPLGEGCSPPVDSSHYVIDSVAIGAFATDLQLSRDGTRLFTPVRGDATLTWARTQPDGTLDCGTRVGGRCDAGHHAGADPNETGNSRGLTMPGEPFGMAQSEDGSAIAITHQTSTNTSLFSAGDPPAMQFIVGNMPTGGNGIAAVPHDQCAVVRCQDDAAKSAAGQCVRPAFLQTSRSNPEIDLLRYYDDASSSVHRPFMQKEAAYGLTTNAGGSDSRGIVIDPTPRLQCERQNGCDCTAPNPSVACVQCGQRPARVFFANRSPASMIVGEIGEPSAGGDGSFDPDRLVITGNVPLAAGPSKIYLAPIIDVNGHYAVRLFIVCFDSSTIFVYDPEAAQLENIIHTGPGPFAMAFDPFSLADAAARAQAPTPDAPGAYRFAYVASFTQSFVQVIDLDASRPSFQETFERVVFTLGQPTPPKGT